MARSSSIGSLFADLTLRDEKFRSGLKGAKSGISNFSKNAVSAVTGLGGRMIAAAGIGSFGAMVTKAIGSASDFGETLSKSETVFGQNAQAIREWAEQADTSLGLSKNAALGAAATLGNMFVGMGMSADRTASMSKRLVELSADLASFNNTSGDDALMALGAALRGEMEPIRRYGVLLDDATLKAKAFAMGIYDGKGSLDPTSKALAAYEVILEKTATAQGDFAKTSDGLANSQRILAANFENAKVELGQGLLPVMQEFASLMKEVDFEGYGREMGSWASTLSSIISGMTSDLMVYTMAASDAINAFSLSDAIKLGTGGWLFQDMDYTTRMQQSMREYYAAIDEMERQRQSRDKQRENDAADQKTYDFFRNWEHQNADSYKEPKWHKAPMTMEEADNILNGGTSSTEGPISIMNVVRPIEDDAADRITANLMPEFDDYQRRGLSLSNTPQNQTEKKMLTTMEQVRDILKTASQNGQPLVWQA